jgi:GT2 family glycosyltransferase
LIRLLASLTTLARRWAWRLHHRWSQAPEHRLFRGLSWSWRWLRSRHHRLFRRQPPVLVQLDGPARLSGFAALAGWAISRNRRVTRVEAFVDGRLIAAGPPTETRGDVARHFPHYRFAGPIGFRLAIAPGTLADGRHDLRLRAHDTRGRIGEARTTLHVEDFQLADPATLPPHLQGSNREYQLWLRRQEPERSRPPRRFRHEPLVSIVMPVHRPNLDQLREAVASVQDQHHERWELCLCDDGSGQPEVTAYLHDLAAREPRLRWRAHPHNQGIAAATSTAIGLGRGDYVAFLDQDDRLAPHALAEVVRALQQGPADLLYTDEDRLDEHGCRIEPLFKPDWSPDLLLARMYLGHLCVYRRAFLDEVGGCRSAFDGAQDWDLALRATARACRVVHIPQVLYHWRMNGSSAGAAFNRLCHERGRRACAEHLRQRNVDAEVADGPFPCSFHIRYRHERQPLVSILIPSRDQGRLLKRCLRSLRRRTEYPHLEILVLDNGSRDPGTLRYLRSCGERVLRLDMPFNHSRLNNLAAAQARGELLLLLNDDTEVLTPGWLTALVEQALRPEVGAAGALLLHPDGRLQHAGIVLGLGPVAMPLHAGITRDGLDRGTVFLAHEVSAVSGACLLIRRAVYQEVGGLDEEALPASYNDVDLCLRLRRAGYRIVYTPLARLQHLESASRSFHDEDRVQRLMQARWGPELARDPYWNPNLPHGPELPPGFALHWPEPPCRSRALRPFAGAARTP